MERAETGRLGEELAVRYLLAEGFELLHRNWRKGRYELDIVARHDDTLHIVEVKSRKADALTAPEEAMTRAKFNALCCAARDYIALYGLDIDTQFDLITVEFEPSGSHTLRYFPQVMTPRW